MDRLKIWIQKKDPKTFAFGILLIFFSLISILELLAKGFTTYYVTGFILFAFLGIAMIRKSKRF